MPPLERVLLWRNQLALSVQFAMASLGGSGQLFTCFLFPSLQLVYTKRGGLLCVVLSAGSIRSTPSAWYVFIHQKEIQ